MSQYVYARVSTDLQSAASQLPQLLQRYPGATLVTEVASGAKSRPLLDALLATLQPGDTLVVAALDRLGRRCSELVALLDSLTARGIVLVSLREGIDLSTIAGRFVGNILCALAQMEREMISERTKSALAAKKAAGVILGRRSSVPKAVVAKMHSMRAAGYTGLEISFAVKLSPTQVSRYLAKSA